MKRYRNGRIRARIACEGADEKSCKKFKGDSRKVPCNCVLHEEFVKRKVEDIQKEYGVIPS